MANITNHQKIWNILQAGEWTTINDIANQTAISADSVALYIRPLYNAGYLEAKTPHSKVKHNHQIKLIKNTGEKAPKLSKHSSILTDQNILEEFYITPKAKKEKEIKNHKNLVPILQSLIKIGKEEVYRQEIWQKVDLMPTALIRWIPRLLEVEILKDTGERYRNSPLYQVDLEKAQKLLELVNKFKSHNLAFSKLSCVEPTQ